MMLVSTAAQDRARKIVESLGGRWNGTRGECLCPAHDNHTPSLSVRLGNARLDTTGTNGRSFGNAPLSATRVFKPDS